MSTKPTNLTSQNTRIRIYLLKFINQIDPIGNLIRNLLVFAQNPNRWTTEAIKKNAYIP